MIIHNVDDHRAQWIGPWEVDPAPLDLARLTLADIGRTVIYQNSAGKREAGTLTSWNHRYIFARFHLGDSGAACEPADLVFAIRDASPEFYHPPKESI